MPDTLSTLSAAEPLPAPTEGPSIRAAPAVRGHTPIRYAGWLAAVDSLAAVAAILTVVMAGNSAAMSGGLHAFLAVRISVKNVLLLGFLATVWPAIFRLFGLYDTTHLRRPTSEAARLAVASALGALMALIVPLTSHSGALEAADVGSFWLIAFGYCLAPRSARRLAQFVRGRHRRRILIVGTGPLARLAADDLQVERPGGHEIVGFVDVASDEGPGYSQVDRPPLGTVDDLERLLMREVVDEVVVALPVKSQYHRIQQTLAVCEIAGVRATYDADLFERRIASPRVETSGPQVVMVSLHVAPDGVALIAKRAIDIVGAVIGLVVAAPMMLIAALAIKLTSGGPVIYAQARCGLNKRPLRMYKFRSMSVDAEELQDMLESQNEAEGPVFKIRDDPRITPVGRWLRRSSLDELPQLWNVLRGDMSLVGPRPLPWRDVHRITRPSDMRRFSMRPGITCLWQVRGRDRIGFDRWVELDLEYIDNWSLLLDVRILLRTLPAVLTGSGAH